MLFCIFSKLTDFTPCSVQTESCSQETRYDLESLCDEKKYTFSIRPERFNSSENWDGGSGENLTSKYHTLGGDQYAAVYSFKSAHRLLLYIHTFFLIRVDAQILSRVEI